MAATLEVGDLLPPLRQSVSPFQLFRYSAVTWNPHRIHIDEEHARAEGHRGLALHSHLRAALALRAVTEGLGPEWRITKVSYRLRAPLYAPTDLTYTARVVAVDGDDVTLELIEANPAGEIGFEGTAQVARSGMTPAPDQGRRPIRVGNCSGFYGDRASAMADMAAAGGIDVLTGDYLAEVTMLILGKARAKDATKGYAVTFLHQLDAALDDLVANGIRVVVNAGGLNPAGLAAATRELAARRGHDLRVAYVDGDDVADRLDELQEAGHPLTHLTTGEPLSSWPHRPLTANAYLGGFGIARALAHGADIVVTGRVADASLVVGAAAWWWGWGPDDHDALAGAMCAGHVIECGTQATGGNFSGFRAIPDLTDAGFPIAEISPDGSSVITKHPGTGGAVTEDTVKAQLLYEIGDPAYLNIDVVTHLDTAELTDLGRRPRRDPGGPRLGAATDHEGGDHRGGRLAEQRAPRPHGHRSRGQGGAGGASRAPLRRFRRRHRRHRRRPHRSGRSTTPIPSTPAPSCCGSRCRAPSRPPGVPSRRTSSSWGCRATPASTAWARRSRDRRSAPTGRRCSTSRWSTTRSTTTTAPPR